MLTAVVDGALMQCTQGDAPCPLTVTSHCKVQADDKPMATIMDHKPGINIKTFGTCKALSGPCVPATTTPWIPGSQTNVKIGDQWVLLKSDQLMCTASGIISISNPMQFRKVQDT